MSHSHAPGIAKFYFYSDPFVTGTNKNVPVAQTTLNAIPAGDRLVSGVILTHDVALGDDLATLRITSMPTSG
jgi:hypothetical protein